MSLFHLNKNFRVSWGKYNVNPLSVPVNKRPWNCLLFKRERYKFEFSKKWSQGKHYFYINKNTCDVENTNQLTNYTLPKLRDGWITISFYLKLLKKSKLSGVFNNRENTVKILVIFLDSSESWEIALESKISHLSKNLSLTYSSL